MTETQQLPWYKEKWVWLLIAIPTSSVIFGIFMLTMAIQGKDSLVRDDYYKDGLMINQELLKDSQAKSLGLTADLMIQEGQAEVVLFANPGFEAPDLLRVKLIHPTLANGDLEFMLVRNGDHYLATLEQALEGRRYIQISDQAETWRLKGESWFPHQTPIRVEPSVPVENE